MTYFKHDMIPDNRMPVMRAIADELVKARNKLEEIGVSLVSDEVYSSSHFSEIQSLDFISQILMEAANLICADSDLSIRVHEIGLQDLRDRLMVAMTQGTDMFS